MSIAEEKYKGCYVVKLNYDSCARYTFTFCGDSYTEPTWYYKTLAGVKSAIRASKRSKRYPNRGF